MVRTTPLHWTLWAYSQPPPGRGSERPSVLPHCPHQQPGLAILRLPHCQASPDCISFLSVCFFFFFLKKLIFKACSPEAEPH